MAAPHSSWVTGSHNQNIQFKKTLSVCHNPKQTDPETKCALFPGYFEGFNHLQVFEQERKTDETASKRQQLDFSLFTFVVQTSRTHKAFSFMKEFEEDASFVITQTPCI